MRGFKKLNISKVILITCKFFFLNKKKQYKHPVSKKKQLIETMTFDTFATDSKSKTFR